MSAPGRLGWRLTCHDHPGNARQEHPDRLAAGEHAAAARRAADPPGTARAHVGAVLAHWQMSALADLAELIATELVTNALRASTTPAGGPCYVNGRVALIWVCLMSDGLRALIEVHDRAEGAPVLRDAGPYAETGRGLHLIDALTGGDWGWYSKRPQPGKCVWAVISLDGETVPQLTALTPAGRREPFTAVPASFRP